MNHEQAARLIDAYLDNELDAATLAAVDEHCLECHACTQLLQVRRELLRRLREPALRYRMPPGLASRLARVAPAPAAPEVRRRPEALRFFALATSALLAIGLFYVGERAGASRDLTEQLLTAHVRALVGAHELDVVSSDHHTVKPWFNGRLSFSPPVPELGASGFRLLGGRIEYLERTRVAVLIYQVGAHHVDVFLWPQTAISRGVQRAQTSEGYRLLSSASGELCAVFVSDLAAQELAAFRDSWLAEAR
jgi:anti-sigma factor RsiW